MIVKFPAPYKTHPGRSEINQVEEMIMYMYCEHCHKTGHETKTCPRLPHPSYTCAKCWENGHSEDQCPYKLEPEPERKEQMSRIEDRIQEVKRQKVKEKGPSKDEPESVVMIPEPKAVSEDHPAGRAGYRPKNQKKQIDNYLTDGW